MLTLSNLEAVLRISDYDIDDLILLNLILNEGCLVLACIDPLESVFPHFFVLLFLRFGSGEYFLTLQLLDWIIRPSDCPNILHLVMNTDIFRF